MIPMSPTLPSLTFCPKHKPLEARHGNAEGPLWKETIPHQGSNQGPLALWVGTVGLLHSSTWGYCSIVVGLMLSPSAFMSPSLPSLAFCPKHKPLEARHGNTESPLWRKTVPRQGLSPGPPALLWSSVIPAPRVITPLLLALYSVLPLYCLT